jgi:hypothetical protein
MWSLLGRVQSGKKDTNCALAMNDSDPVEAAAAAAPPPPPAIPLHLHPLESRSACAVAVSPDPTISNHADGTTSSSNNTNNSAADAATALTESWCPMKVIQPAYDSEPNRRAVQLLHWLDELLQQPQTHARLERELRAIAAGRRGTNRNDESLRRIQGGRIEIFCRARNHRCTVFEQLCDTLHRQLVQRQKKRRLQQQSSDDTNHVNPIADIAAIANEVLDNYPFTNGRQIKKAILDYCESQARRDARIGGLVHNGPTSYQYLFDNFSLLVNYLAVPAQTIHLDMQEPNFQFGLIVTNATVPTRIYRPSARIRTVADVRRYAWPDLPDSLAEAMAQDGQLPDLIDKFGDLLCPVIAPVAISTMPVVAQATSSHDTAIAPVVLNQDRVATGTLLSLPGSVIHAGPACDGFRAVLFFTAWPGGGVTDKDCESSHSQDAELEDPTAPNNATVLNNTDTTPKRALIPPYDPDTQYSTPLLISDMTMVLWDGIEQGDRIYLLTKLVDAIQASNYRSFYRHLTDALLIDFTKTIGYGLCPPDKVPEFVARFAKNDDAVGSLRAMGLEQTVGSDRVSVALKGLEVALDGEWSHCQLYLSTTTSTTTTAPSTSEQKDLPSESSSNDQTVDVFFPEDKRWEYSFHLIMSSCTTSLFDGNNGKLINADGLAMPCRCPRQRHRKRTVTSQQSPNAMPDEASASRRKRFKSAR